MAKKPPSQSEQKNEGSRKNGTSTRSKAGQLGRKQGTPSIMLVAVVVVILGCALLFWPKGGSKPTGIGESQSIVTAPDSAAQTELSIHSDTPRSGDVEIADQGLKMTPETPHSDQQPSEDQESEKVVVKTEKPKASQSQPVKKVKSNPKPDAPAVKPGTEGRWAVQTGGFGDAANADKEAARLGEMGFKAMVRAGSNSQGTMVYRVWIGYFTSRDQGNTFLKQNKKNLADAFVVHR
ncbi:MAG: hypothetical protein GY780_05700 [bacterium]|nr:hypothetical protein [bacterium]